MTLRRIARFCPIALVALAFPSTAWAHATLVRSDPADRAVLAAAPREVRFLFDDTVQASSGIKAIRNGGGSVLGGRARVVGSRTLVVPLRPIGNGDYTVLWRVVSDDGHTIVGVMSFAVGTGRAPPIPALSAPSTRSAREVVSRWLFFVGLLVAVGSALFRFVVGRGQIGVLFAALLLTFLGGIGLIGRHGGLSTRFGVVYGTALVVASVAATLAGIALADRRAAAPAWGLTLLLIPAPSLAGHALDPGRPFIEVPVDMLHVAAAAFWLGGLVQLAVVLRRTDVDRRDVARRFSKFALISVALLSITGLVRALTELGAVSRTWTTGYGRLLIVKTALLVLLVALGWLNRAHLLPRLSFETLRRSIAAELLLLAGLVVAVALLTDSRPGRNQVAVAAAIPSAPALPPLPARDAIVLAQEDGDRAVALAAEPHGVRVTVLGADGLAADGLGVSILGAPTADCGAGCYETDASPRSTVPVVIDGKRLSFHVPRSAPPASALVSRATRAFRSLRSVTYVERLASGPRNRIVSTFTLERPDRVEYRIRGGADGIVIGTRRWDREPGGRWRASPTTLLPQPLPFWGERVTNARLLGRTGSAYLVSFLNPSIPAWFTVRLDRRTLHPIELRMTAAAHFMHHRYTAFDAPRRIFPPR